MTRVIGSDPILAVEGISTDGTGVDGNSTNGIGVAGISTNSIGIYGSSGSEIGVLALSGSGPGSPGSRIGLYSAVYGPSTTQGRGIVSYIYNPATPTNPFGNPARLAGLFFGNVTIYGDVQISGALSKGGGGSGFKIDHPLDPANKYLSHSFVESPEMKNLYDGVAVLDAQGEAIIELPPWFEALNQDFRYQLTPIGAAGPNLYIAEEISDQRFKIAGGTPGMKIC